MTYSKEPLTFDFKEPSDKPSGEVLTSTPKRRIRSLRTIIWLREKKKRQQKIRHLRFKHAAGQSKVEFRPRSTSQSPCPFGDYIQHLRICLGWSANTAAKELYYTLPRHSGKNPVSGSIIIRMESEQRFPNFALQRRMLKIYRPDPAEFYARLNRARMRKGLGPIVPISELKEWQEKVSSVLWLRAKLKESALQAKKMVVVGNIKGEETVYDRVQK